MCLSMGNGGSYLIPPISILLFGKRILGAAEAGPGGRGKRRPMQAVHGYALPGNVSSGDSDSGRGTEGAAAGKKWVGGGTQQLA